MPVALLGVAALGLGGWLMAEVNKFNSPEQSGGLSPVVAGGIALGAAYLTYKTVKK